MKNEDENIRGVYINLLDFEGGGRTAKVSFEALTAKNTKHVAGKIGKRIQKSLVGRKKNNGGSEGC